MIQYAAVPAHLQCRCPLPTGPQPGKLLVEICSSGCTPALACLLKSSARIHCLKLRVQLVRRLLLHTGELLAGRQGRRGGRGGGGSGPRGALAVDCSGLIAQ